MATQYHPTPVAGIEFSSSTRTGGSVPAKYEAYLYKPVNNLEPMKFTIKLRINLRQLNPAPLPFQRDANGQVFWTIPWTAADWMNFVSGAVGQANIWNNKLWLVAPDSFTEYGYKNPSSFPGAAWRPNVRCELEVDFSANGDAHKTIDVANLDLTKLTGVAQNSKTFRSHSLLYDSLDTVPMISSWAKAQGVTSGGFTIAHEIGHAIGLGHIGVIKKTPLCVMAQTLTNMGLGQSGLTKGGENSMYCYGHSQGVAVAGNIMGGGADFTSENGLPWVWAMMVLRGKNFERWSAVAADPGPGSWVKL